MEQPTSYIPMDRRQALYRSEQLPDPAHGAALFADISGFTPLTEQLVHDLGPQRGAEEITRHLNRVYDGLIDELHRYGGSVINFSGDAITCWFEGDSGFRATYCAFALKRALQQVQTERLSSDEMAIAMKTAVVTGTARRFLIGNPHVQLIDVLAGKTLDRLVEAEHEAKKGEVILDETTINNLGARVQIKAWRQNPINNERLGVVESLEATAVPSSWAWPTIPADAFDEAITRRWLLPPVYRRLVEGGGEFLAELRPAVALFVRFSGIDYDADEEAETKLDTFVQNVQEILSRYDSNLLQLTIGDKGSALYAAFGAPFAHEDDAVRAVTVALELQELAIRLPYISPLQIGICQGRLRTGAYGGTMRRTYGVLGDAVNTAARLMQAAVPGQILVNETTMQQTGERFTWEALPPVQVKGKTEPLTIYTVVRRQPQTTIRLQEPQYALPMVGRAAELALIQEKMAVVRQGQGQILVISGEAGIGKSRLVAQIIRLAGEQEFLGLGGECQSYGTNTSYLVWQRIWQDFFELSAEMSVDEQITHIGQQLQAFNLALLPRLPLLGAVLRLTIPDNELTQTFDAQLRKVSLESLLVECVRARAEETAVLLVLEDCHWLDPLSFELLESLSRAIVDRPILIVLAVRSPETNRVQTASFRQLLNFTEIKLNEFTPEEAEHLMALKLELLTQIKIPRLLRDKITERAAGNPFYIEELLNYLQSQSAVAGQTLQDLDLPTSLHSLILSRIDQLTESQRNTLKVASVIGRLFRAAMLWGAYPPLGGPQQVKADLEALERLDLTPLDTPEPELTYLFKNVVTQEVAYESLPFSTRAMLHDLIGQYIEKNYSHVLSQYVGLLAYHYGRSDNEIKKREYLLKAGEVAQAEYANEAAIEYFQRVLPLLPEVERASAMRKLGNVLELVGKWDEASELYIQALQLAQKHHNQQEEAWCDAAQAELLRKQGRYEEATTHLETARLTFEKLEDEAGVAQAYHSAGTLAAQQGQYEKARTLYEKSLVLRQALEQPAFIAALLSNLAIIARFQGDLGESRRLNERALEIRRRIGDRRTIANSLNNLGNVVRNLGDLAKARSHLEEALQLQREVGDRWAIANSLNNLGNVVRDQADFETARQLYVESLMINHEFGDRRAIAYVLEDMAALSAAQNEAGWALRLLGAAQTLRQEIGAPLSAVEQTQLDGRLTAVLDHPDGESFQEQGRQLSLAEAIAFVLGTHALEKN